MGLHNVFQRIVKSTHQVRPAFVECLAPHVRID